jgi:hypothetical protein
MPLSPLPFIKNTGKRRVQQRPLSTFTFFSFLSLLTPKATPKYQVSNCKNDSILALSILNTEA